MSGYKLSAAVREILEQHFVDERDLIENLAEQRCREDPAEPETYTCSFFLAVRRPMDLETAELRRVEVRMRALRNGYEVLSVAGLEDVS